MKNYIPLSEEQKAELKEINGYPCNGYISFFLKGEEVASTDLLEYSGGTDRLRTAEMIGVKGFDDYWLLTKEKEVRAKASEIVGLTVADDEQDYGKSEGVRYQRFLKRHEEGTCGNCGRKIG